MPDRAHAVLAIKLSSGKPEEKRVRAFARKKYGIGDPGSTGGPGNDGR